MASPLDRRICPGCGRTAGKRRCRRCYYEAGSGPLARLRDLLDPASGDGPEADAVALGAFVRAVVAAWEEARRKP